MPKGKSSASAGTRKKHAKKAAGKEGEDGAAPKQQPKKLQRGQKKLSKAQQKALPKIKQYIPPPKPPAPPIPDPLDGQGLARTLPAELVVVLRRLGKKDDVTRRKGLEELKEGWVSEIARPASGEDDEVEKEIKETALVSAVPVWMHNLASLLQSPFHRSFALGLHAEMLAISSIRTAILDTLSLSLLPGTQNRDILGSWLVAALEEGRRAGGAGLRSWDESTCWLGGGAETDGRIDLTPQHSTIVEYLSLAILDPPSLHDDIHPAPVQANPAPTPAPSKGGKTKGKQPYVPPTPTAPEPTTEESEMAEERWARYRVGGLVGLAWLLQHANTKGKPLSEDLGRLIHNTALWSSLSSLPSEEGSPAFGHQHPPVRRAAYSVLSTIVDGFPDEVAKEEMLQTLAREMLDTIWLEKETTVWETAGSTVARILSRHRGIWKLSAAGSDSNDDPRDGQEGQDGKDDQDDGEDGENDSDTSDGEDEGEDEAADVLEQPPQTASVPSAPTSVAFDRFLDFISTICPTIPHHTYPLLVVIISTLPNEALPLDEISPQLETLFAHLWSPVDARLLSTHALPGQPSAFQAFLRDTVDCTTYLVGKAKRTEAGDAAAEWLVSKQLGERAWKEGVLELGGRSAGRRAVAGARSEQEATIFAQSLARILAISTSLGIQLVDVVTTSVLDGCSSGEDDRKAMSLLPRVVPILQTVRDAVDNDDVKKRIDSAIGSVADLCIRAIANPPASTPAKPTVYAETLVSILTSETGVLSTGTRSGLISTFESSSSTLASQLSPTHFAALLEAISAMDADFGARSRAVLRDLSRSTAIDRANRFAVLQAFFDSRSSLLSSDSIDSTAEEATLAALNESSTFAAKVAASCVSHEQLSADSLQTVLALVCTAIHDSVYDLLTVDQTAQIPNTAIEIFAAYAKAHLTDVIASDIYAPALVGLHHLVVLLPRLHEVNHSVSPVATSLWETTAQLPSASKDSLDTMVLQDLAGLVQDVACRVEPSVLVDVALIVDRNLDPQSLASKILPDATHIQQAVSEYTSRPSDPTLCIVEPIISGAVSEELDFVAAFDAHGRSKAARLSEAALALIKADRSLASSNPTLLQTILSARALAQDALAVPGASRGFLAKDASAEYLEGVIREAEGTLSFSLGAFDEVDVAWHKRTIELLKRQAGKGGGADFLQDLLSSLVARITSAADDVPARTVRDVLARHLRQSGAGEAEAELWLAYGMSKAESNPTLSLAVLLAVKPLLLDTKALETAQNRLASSLSGVPARQANDKGVPALRLLSASAPPADAASVFIPQQRAMFVLRHIASWLASDDSDDLEEEVETRMAEMYTAVAPVVQDMPGAHWDSIFDLIETGLDAATLDDPTSYGLLYHCLLLLQQTRDLCESNKALRASWTSKKTHLSLALKLFLQCRDAASVPLQMIQDLLLDLLRDVGDDIVGDGGVAELCELLGKSSSYSVQATAYRLLSQVVKRKTLALVLEVEASVSEEPQEARRIELPAGLIEILTRGALIDWHEEPAIDLVLGQLLAWMSVLDYFDDASRTLRWAYLDQLNSSDLLASSLLPMLFAILGVSEVNAWNFPSSAFAVDEFYPDLLQPEELPDLAPLASHVFYRALVTIPSAVRTYYEGLKDRQLYMSMLNFTARHYSPVIIQHEFAALRQPAAMAQLTEEGLNIRIAQGGGATVAAGSGSSEAIASYVVDEQPMEIGIRLPAEFPLRGVDVRDLRRVGVPENKWRGWLMSVQQTITSRNGLILEALTVFKRNVSLHFEGVVECAICYSIISLTDRTLPTKPCRTCKNRFHASCLYKWFNSSHSSSCPLCRALF